MSNQWRVLGHRGHSAFSIRCYRECEWTFWPTHMPLFQGHEPCSGLKNFHVSGLFWNSTPCPSTSQMNYRHKTLMLQKCILQTKSQSSLTHVQIISHGHNGRWSSHSPSVLNTNTLFQTFFGPLKAGWHHQFDGHEFEWTPGVGDGQGGLVCCDSRGRKESDTTERLKWLNWKTGFLVTRPPQERELSSRLILWHTNSFEVPLPPCILSLFSK